MDFLTKKLGVGIVLTAVGLGASGCLKTTSYEDKCDYLKNEGEYRDARVEKGIIVPIVKYEFD